MRRLVPKHALFICGRHLIESAYTGRTPFQAKHKASVKKSSSLIDDLLEETGIDASDANNNEDAPTCRRNNSEKKTLSVARGKRFRMRGSVVGLRSSMTFKVNHRI